MSPAQPGPKPICFQCYRAELQRDKALKAAGQLDTASDARFQSALPFDPVNTVRLAALKAARVAERQALGVPAQPRVQPPVQPVQRCVDRRRQAQIAARHALRAIGDGLRTEHRTQEKTALVAVTHAAELQLPESWLPFVMSR